MSKVGLLLSGGMDSYALAYKEKPDIAVTIDYGQKPADAELKASGLIADRLNIKHINFSTDLSKIGSGDLCGKPAILDSPNSEWWPYRNQLLITIAAMCLIPFDVKHLLIATVSTDLIHQDGTKEFIEMSSNLLSMQEGKMKVAAPAINMTTSELVKTSRIPYSLLAWSHSCHTENIACGQCGGCHKHRKVVHQLGYAET